MVSGTFSMYTKDHMVLERESVSIDLLYSLSHLSLHLRLTSYAANAHTPLFLLANNKSPLKAGMIVSNEPGYYADGKFGIRIESLVIIKEVKTPWNFGDKGFLAFECVTMYVDATGILHRHFLSLSTVLIWTKKSYVGALFKRNWWMRSCYQSRVCSIHWLARPYA